MRTSPVHYIAPSAISIVPNCNNSANDLAVTISRGTKIKVYSPRADIDKTTDGEYQEWNLSGRNRRLADSTKPYTIYARLSALDNTAYLIFAQMTPQEGGEYMGEWTQAYSWVTTDGLYVFGKGSDWEEQRTKTNCIFVRLGDVSLPDANNQRTVTLDTGILGTDQFNDEWALRPDELPLRIELGCTINDEDAGSTPYVYWGQRLVLTAMLTEGWTGTDIQRFDRWEIVRNSGDAAADNAWNYQEVEGQDTLSPRLMPDGQITLQHIFGGTDDFNGAVSVTFTILAVGHNADTLQREILKTATINIMAETVATYELEQSSAAVTYNPLDNTYSPTNGVSFRIRTKAQDGSVSFADDSHIALAQLRLYALPEGDATENRTRLTFTGGTATLPVTDFVGGKSINLMLENGAQVVLARTTVAYIRYGEKGDTPISIYRWYKVGLTPLKPTSTSSEEPAPAAGDATGAANVYPTDKWSKAMPDRPATGEWNLWQCNSIKHGSGTIDTWSTPVRISGDKGTAGEDGSDREYIYIRQNTYPFSGTLPANISTGEVSPQGIADGSETDKTQDDWVPNGWSDTALPADNDNRYVYMAVREKLAGAGRQWGPFGNPVLWSNWGVRGTDGDGVEHVFIRTKNNVPPIMDSIQTGYASDEFRPTITSASQTASLTEQAQTTDDPKGPNSTYPYEWVATRSKGDAASDGTRQWTKYTGKNNDYTMSLWSRWAEDGGTPISIYRWYKVGLTPLKPTSTSSEEPAPAAGDATGADNVYPTDKWSKTMPDRPATGEWALWMCGSIRHGSGIIDAWSTPVRISGDKGTPGEDASDTEWIYKHSSTVVSSLPQNNDTSQDGYVPTSEGWNDHPQGIDITNIYEYACYRTKDAGTGTRLWSSWKGVTGGAANDAPILWSNWGRNGIDGDGVEYVFARTNDATAPVVPSSGDYSEESQGYDSDEHRPYVRVPKAKELSGENDTFIVGDYKYADCTDEPVGTSSEWKYEWVLKRSKGSPSSSTGEREWEPYSGAMKQWVREADDGESPWVADMDNEMDSVACNQGGTPAITQTVETTVKLWHGSTQSPMTIAVFDTDESGDAYVNGVQHDEVVQGVKVTWNNSTGVVSVQFDTTADFSDGKIVLCICVTSTEDNTVVRYLFFTVNGIMPGANGETPTIYNLLPSQSNVSVSRTSAGGYVQPEQPVLTCGYVKKHGADTPIEVSNATAIFDGYRIYFRRRIRAGATIGDTTYNNDTWETNYIAYNGSQTESNRYVNARQLLSTLAVTSYNAVEFYISSDDTSVVAVVDDSAVFVKGSLSSIIDKETVPVVTDGANGTDGTQYQRKYKRSSSAVLPEYTDDSSWSDTIISPTDIQRYVYVAERIKQAGASLWGEWNVALFSYKSEDGTSIPIRGVAVAVSTGSGVNEQGDTTWPNPSDGDIVLENGTYNLADAQYWDGNTSSWIDGLPNGTNPSVGDGFIINSTGHLWTLSYNDNRVGRWVDCGQIRGENGDDAEYWHLEVQDGIESVDFTADYAGAVTANPLSVTLVIRHVKGSTVDEVLSTLPTGYYVDYLNDNGVWDSDSLGSKDTGNYCSDGSYDAVFRLRRDNTELNRVTLRCRWQYQRMLLPAGKYVSKEYTRTPTTTPLVLYEQSGEYFFLIADTNKVGNSFIGPKDLGQRVWQKANDYDVVLTKMLFAQFAQLGGFIVYDNYFFSRYGTLFHYDNGNVVQITINASNVNTQYDNRVPYGWFDSTDPMVSTNPTAVNAYKFRPSKCINALTGEEWAAGGNVHFSPDGSVDVSGTIRAKNLYHGVCIVGQETYGYCTQAWIDLYQSESWIENFQVGGYYTEEQARQLSGGQVGIQNMTPCTYDADVVICPNLYNNSNPRYVRLPRAEDFEGKIVEVIDNAYSNGQTIGNISVHAVDSGYFGLGIDANGVVRGDDYSVISGERKARFYSIYNNDIWWWLRIE